MTVMGVLRSCEASVINCFCRSDACPTGAIRFSTDFEHAVYTREKLVKQLNKQ